jgi:glycerol-3-phosphate acyltransferase PlsY
MNLWVGLLAAIGGYLIGSLSFARIVMRAAAGRTQEGALAPIRRQVESTGADFGSTSISATAVREELGARYGCLTALLDAGKAAVPALVLRLLFPGQPYAWIAATTAIVGHNYPLYHRFRGGRGLSTVYGGFMVMDWPGTLVTALAGLAIGILSEQAVLVRWLGLLLMIPWTWFRTRDPVRLLYVLAANLLFWTAMIPELRQAAAFVSPDARLDSSEIADVMGMGKMWQVVRKYSLPSLLKRLRSSGPRSQ